VSLYLILKWLHVLFTIVAVGANLTYGVWLARAARDPAVLPFVLRGVKILDDRMANPAYGLLLVSGLAMTYVGGLPLSTPWIGLGLGLYILLVLVALLGYTPTLRGQVRLAEAGDTGAEFQALASRGRTLGIVLGVLVVAIVFVMVVKPSF
jgi:uncharacterized membrane protein